MEYKELEQEYCQYGVKSYGTPDQFRDCGEMAMFKVWWKGEDVDPFYLCEEHFSNVVEDEKVAQKATS